jgi:hypothetical protein
MTIFHVKAVSHFDIPDRVARENYHGSSTWKNRVGADMAIILVAALLSSRPIANRNRYTTFHVEDPDDDHPIEVSQTLSNAARNLPRGRHEPAYS